MTTPRPTLADLGMSSPNECELPVTFRFYMSTPWGATQSELTLDLGAFVEKPDQLRAFGRLLWSLSIAPAISFRVKLLWTDMMVWRGALGPETIPGDEQQGQKIATASSRIDTVQYVLVPGQSPPEHRRRLFIPGCPASWSQDGLMTTEGWEGAIAHARQLYMGFQPIAPDPSCHWLIAYPGVVEPTIDNLRGVGFKQVTHVHVCHHTDRAPDLQIAGWF